MRIHTRLDQGETTVITILDNSRKLWVIFSHADGTDRLVSPSGGIWDDFERLPIEAQRVMEWFYLNV
jgi:hypothetical protein